jgi:hypothetical protein
MMELDKKCASIEASDCAFDRLIYAIQHDSDQTFNRLRIEVLINQALMEQAATDDSAARIEQQAAEIAHLQCQLVALRAKAQTPAIRLHDASRVDDAANAGTDARVRTMAGKLKRLMEDATYQVRRCFSRLQLKLSLARTSRPISRLRAGMVTVCAQAKATVKSWGSQEDIPPLRSSELAADIDAARAIAAQHTCCSRRRAPCSFECACYFEAKAKREGSTTPTTSADSAS